MLFHDRRYKKELTSHSINCVPSIHILYMLLLLNLIHFSCDLNCLCWYLISREVLFASLLSILGFRIWRCGTCFFFTTFMGFCHSGFRIQARTYSVQVYNFATNWHWDPCWLTGPCIFWSTLFCVSFRKGRQNVIFSVEPKCDLNIRPTSVHWITVKY